MQQSKEISRHKGHDRWVSETDDPCNSNVVKGGDWASPTLRVQGVYCSSYRIYGGDRHSFGTDSPDKCGRVQRDVLESGWHNQS